MEGIDWHRMFIGDEPPIFLLEIVIRTIIIYSYTLILLRLLGSRAIGQLSTVEFLLVIALGSAVGDAMFYPDVPLIHSLLVVTVVVVANKLIDLGIARSKSVEHIIDGKPEQAIRTAWYARPFSTAAPWARANCSRNCARRASASWARSSMRSSKPMECSPFSKIHVQNPGCQSCLHGRSSGR